jgi:phage terminase large subunit
VPTIDIGYIPRKQFIDFHKRRERWALLVAHRRAGKTVACIHDLVDGAMRCKHPNARFVYLAPFYRQAKDVAWQILKDTMKPFGPAAVANEAELRVDYGDKRIRLYGADNYDALRGIHIDGIVLDEYADMDPRAWPEVIRPALSDRDGWAVFIGTPKGENDFYTKYQAAKDDADWYTTMLKGSETGIISKEELAGMRSAMTKEQYNQEIECSFRSAVVGAYYGDALEQAEKDGRITSVPLDSELEVHSVGTWVLATAQLSGHISRSEKNSGLSTSMRRPALA